MNLRHWLTHPVSAVHRLRYWIWEKRNPNKPWLCPGTVRFCEANLLPSMVALEFGSGRSTPWFARKVGRLTSVEHNADWYRLISGRLAEAGVDNVAYRFVPLEHPETQPEQDEYPRRPAYVAVLDEFAEASLDLVIVDGHYRTHCIQAAIPRLRSGGYLLVDDMNLWHSPEDVPVPRSWPVVDESSNGLKSCRIWQVPPSGFVPADS
jgi:hypothetical protein